MEEIKGIYEKLDERNKEIVYLLAKGIELAQNDNKKTILTKEQYKANCYTVERKNVKRK